jgi:hypothetical protein
MNKSQGKPLKTVFLNPGNVCFAHGRLYADYVRLRNKNVYFD